MLAAGGLPNFGAHEGLDMDGLQRAVKQWIATKAMETIRNDHSFPEEVAYWLGGVPVIDELRLMLEPSDVPHLLRMIEDRAWWHRYLGTSAARRLAGDAPELSDSIRTRWQGEEHFHTKLAMIFFLLYCNPTEQLVAGFVEELDRSGPEYLKCFRKFFEGHELGVWGGVCSRLSELAFQPSAPLHLLGMALMAEGGDPDVGEMPSAIPRLRQSEAETVTALAERLSRALGN